MADNNPKYYWLKLMDDFFFDKRIKKLRKSSAGDTTVLIYLKMMLKAINNGGVLNFEGLEDNFYEELALDIDEEEQVCKDVIETLSKCGLLETEDGISYFLPEVTYCTGGESAAAERMRRKRKGKTEQERNSSVTDLNNVQICSDNVQKCYTEKEKEKDIEKDIDSDTEEECAAKAAQINLPLQNGEDYPIFSSEIKKWKELYPNVNIEQELRTIKGWLEANPGKRKIKQNLPGFINAWFTRKQENPREVHIHSGDPKQQEYIPDKCASYDIMAATEKMNKSVPKLPPKKKRSPS